MLFEEKEMEREKLKNLILGHEKEILKQLAEHLDQVEEFCYESSFRVANGYYLVSLYKDEESREYEEYNADKWVLMVFLEEDFVDPIIEKWIPIRKNSPIRKEEVPQFILEEIKEFLRLRIS